MKKISIVVLGAILAALMMWPAAASAVPDNTGSMNRIRVVMMTTSDWSQLKLPAGDTIVYSKGGATGGSAGVVVVNTDNLFVGRNTIGQPATVQFDMLITTDGTNGGWQITKGWGQTSHVEIYNINDSAHPVLLASIDDNEPQGTPTNFIISGAAESAGGPLSAATGIPRKVFAVYYPWWTSRNNWSTNPDVGDAPATRYDVDNEADVSHLIDSAIASGIDGFLGSWQGSDHFSDTGFRTLLRAANGKPGFNVGVYLETRVANAGRTDSQPPDPAYLRQWITDLVNYSRDPANTSFLKVNGKPVIFVYWVKDLSPSRWKNEVFDPLRAQGIDAFYIADYTGGTGMVPYEDYLAVFDGMHMFNPSVYSNIPYVLENRSIRTKTYSLLENPGAQRKLWVGTAVPGMDGRKIGAAYVDRANGATYTDLWQNNMDTNPDWMMISTWNDYYECTHIEDSVLWGSAYLDLTRSFAAQFKSPGDPSPLSITDVNASPFLPLGVEATWQTDRAANSIIEAGTSPGSYTHIASSGSLSGSHKLALTGLSAGTWYVRVRSTDANGIGSISSETVVTVPNETVPRLSISEGRSYWTDYASYRDRKLNVDFLVANAGPGDANSLEITHVDSSAGTVMINTLPLPAVNVPGGSSRVISVQWSVPSGINNFSARMWAQAVSSRGTRIYYPGPSPE